MGFCKFFEGVYEFWGVVERGLDRYFCFGGYFVDDLSGIGNDAGGGGACVLGEHGDKVDLLELSAICGHEFGDLILDLVDISVAHGGFYRAI